MFIQNIISLVTIPHSAGSEAALESSRYLFIKPVKYESVTGIKKKIDSCSNLQIILCLNVQHRGGHTYTYDEYLVLYCIEY